MSLIRLSDILQANLKEYKKKYPLSAQQSKVLGALSKCRTGALGYAEVTCECGEVIRMPLSCRDRHCPRCQGRETAEWILRECGKLLPVPYYHFVFTVPDQLHPFFRYNEALLYDLLFKTAVSSIQTFAGNDNRLGCRLGITAILHTWGQRLQYHPHVHMIVAGGGVDALGRWKQVDPDYGPWLFSVNALSLHFRGKLLSHIERLFRQGELTVPPGISVPTRLRQASQRSWSVFSQCASAGAEKVLQYLGRYTRKAAIGESRLLELNEKTVRFRAKDRRRGTEGPVCLHPQQFIHRLRAHILPRGFRRLRQYGWHVRGAQQARKACNEAARAIREQWLTLLAVLEREKKRFEKHTPCCPKCGCSKDAMPLPVLLLPGYTYNDSG